MKKKVLIFSVIILFIAAVGIFQLKAYGYFEDINVEVGSSTGNIYSGGNAAEDKKNMYFSNYDKKGKLYKMDKKTKKLTKLCDDIASYINVLNEYIYYSNISDGEKIYKIKIDGSNREKLGNSIAEYIRVRGNYIYYSNGDDDNCLYKMRIDGKKNRKILNTYVDGFNIINNKIYYLKNQIFYSVTVNGHFNKKLYEGNMLNAEVILGDYIQIKDENIYFSNKGKIDENRYLCKADLKNFKFERLTDENVKGINVHENDIYYINESDGDSLYTIKTDGSQRKKLKEGPISRINIVGDYIFYFKDIHGEIYRMNVNTKNNKKISNVNPTSMDVHNNKIFYTTDIKRDKRRGSLSSIDINTQKEKMLSYVEGGWEKIILVENDWVYFTKVTTDKTGVKETFYRIKIDGSNMQEIHRNFDEVEDRIKAGFNYYIDSSTDGKGCALYRKNIDTGKINILVQNESEYIKGIQSKNDGNITIKAVTDKYVYYSINQKSKGLKVYSHLYKVALNGKDDKLISKDTVTNLVESQGYLYYGTPSDTGALYRMKLDGNEKNKILDGKIDNINLVAIKDEWIYYNCGTDGNRLYRIKTDGTHKERIFNSRDISFINIEGDYIYYDYASMENKQFIIKNTEI
ncbi:DUF5050 domain-containing protein [Clostridium sp. ZS2-4]|uniref:DUF5050 domain-containing protein n=1 Tax=Clostridium sp. ZS2-4 TaxID=2987703 RepID=UPI00227C09C0|nr:DUF5050 domain-containing protein [Clostridium sp. ZS2-4]MCY6356691.1 DUF5050 domain-containing protein [Clostridium sp. ZS2-4]